ncbi:MAG TPA: ABC transporter permease [Candidatus Saccharibacteria bacterium]|nr:ABC transporter permease [Candidatus Saccharibacteria bacterium]
MVKSGLLDKKNRVLLYELVKTDFKLRYQGSFLGILWSVLKPLLLFTVMYTVFVKFLRFTDGTSTYPLVLLLGISLWSFFTEATNVGMQSIVSRGDILRKINFPKYIIILSSMASAMISLTINLAVVVVFMLFSGVKLTPYILLLPINILQLFMLAFGLALLLSTLYVKFRDIGHIWDVVIQILFYSIPIIYPLTQVADFRVMGIAAQNIIMLNPIGQIIQDIRHNLISPVNVPTAWDIQPTIWIAITPVILTIVIVVVGAIYFRKNSKKFAEIM